MTITKEVAIRLIQKKYDVSKCVACELYLLYRKANKLKNLYVLLHDLDLDEYNNEQQNNEHGNRI